tara:strand:- start:426 stop:605 length:180 start_codon:yes stop_codon:yes gene_type:complete
MSIKNVERVCKSIEDNVTYCRNWVGLNNELLRLGLDDPQILVDYILYANGDPHLIKREA